MLPEPDNRPPVGPELSGNFSIAFHVALYLVAPELFRQFFLPAIPVSVPEVAVAEDQHLFFNDKVRTSENIRKPPVVNFVFT